MVSILIVEDESLVALDIQGVLEQIGYRVVGIASSFNEAIAEVERGRPDIVLMDINIKGERDGVQAADMIRVRFGTPVIFLTAHADPATVARAKAVNPYGYLLKPFTERELLATLEVALQRYAVERQLAEKTALLEELMDRMQEQTRLLESVLENIGDGVVVVDSEKKLVVVNPAAKSIMPYAVGETAAGDWSLAARAFLPDGVTRFPVDRGPLLRGLRGEASDGVEMMLETPSGQQRSFSVTTRPILAGNEVAAAVAVFRDFTERKLAQKQLMESEQWYRVLSEASFEGVAVTAGGEIIETNATFAAFLGYSAEELRGVPGLSLFTPEERERVMRYSNMDEVSYEASMLRKDGSVVQVEIRGRFVTFRDRRVRIAAVRDVTEKKRREAQLAEQAERLRHQSLHDELTGLYNRRGFMNLAENGLSNGASASVPCAIFFADLNGMKLINDQLGHEAGDDAIREAATILVRVFGHRNLVARLGGDEFAIFVSDCNEDDVILRTAAIEEAVAAFNENSPVQYRLSITVGAAVCHSDQRCTLSHLMHAADGNMYELKRRRHSQASIRVKAR